VIRLRSLLLISLFAMCAGCAKTQSAAEKTAPALTAAQPAADTSKAAIKMKQLDLMKYSTLDSCNGDFEGSYEEKVPDTDITCSATVRVHLENCRITAITIVDTSHVHPTAAQLIPQRIVASQSLPVDAVSGASVASWTLMTATAVALGIDLTELENLQEK
jgi:uncharacterized protein with FMN-binding domain